MKLSNQIFVKGYGFLSIPKNTAENIGKSISKNFSSYCSQKLLDHVKKSATDAFKTASKRSIQKTAEATGHLIGNKIVDKIIKVIRTSPQNNLETVESETDNMGFNREIPKERYIYIYQEKRQKNINDPRLKKLYSNGISKNKKSVGQ